MPISSVSLSVIKPTALRIKRLAHKLFGGYGADVIWREAGDVARLTNFDGDRSATLPSQWIMARGEALWIEDFATDPVALEYGLKAASPRVKTLVGVPIRSDGVVLGVLLAIDLELRPRDEDMLQSFRELADLLAEAFMRVRADEGRDRAEAELREALAEAWRVGNRLRLATDLARLRVWELDLRSDEAFEGVRRRNVGSLAGAESQIWSQIHEDDRARAQAEWAAHLAGGPPMRSTYRLLDGDTTTWVESAAEVIRDESGEVVQVIGALRSVEREKQAEQTLIAARDAADAASAAKSGFVAMVSHELRTPLNGILGMAQVMAGDELSATQRERLAIIRQSGDVLREILNDVLDLSKIGAGRLDLQTDDFDLAQATEGAVATFRSLAADKGLDLRFAAEPGVLGAWRGDALRWRQVVGNLVSNAVKFTEAGHVEVTLGHDGDNVVLRVADTGSGIAEDVAAQLFQPFVQADSSLSRRHGGTGLGLAICRQLLTLMGGAVDLDSAPGRGSCFTVKAPLERGGSIAAPIAPTRVAPRAALRVLAAEDNPVNRVVLKSILEQVGLDVTLVEDGAAAVAAWSDGHWDVVLMDVQMPVQDGLESTRQIRRLEQSSQRPRTPIVALTANALSHHAAEYQAAGMDGVVAKPIEVAALLEAIDAVLASAGAGSEPASGLAQAG